MVFENDVFAWQYLLFRFPYQNNNWNSFLTLNQTFSFFFSNQMDKVTSHCLHQNHSICIEIQRCGEPTN